MATRAGSTAVLRPTLLDRLIEPQGGPGHATIGLRELKRAVARDLEWLLNTRNELARSPELANLAEARASVLTYGVPDNSSGSRNSKNDRARVRREIASAVRTFEPRLVPATVVVTDLEAPRDVADSNLRFRIEGTLHVEPISEPVFFDSTVELTTGEFHVDGSL
jgi:type VI secretion system protein ImpF